MERLQVDQHIDQGILIGNGPLVAQAGPLDAQRHRLAVDPFAGGALLVQLFVSGAFSIQLVAKPCARGGPHRQDTTAIGPLFVVDGAGITVGFRVQQRAGIASHLLGYQPSIVLES